MEHFEISELLKDKKIEKSIKDEPTCESHSLKQQLLISHRELLEYTAPPSPFDEQLEKDEKSILKL